MGHFWYTLGFVGIVTRGVPRNDNHVMNMFTSQAFAAPQSQRDHQALIETLATRICARRMAAPAVLLLESVKPLARLTSQLLLVLSPLLSIFVSAARMDEVIDLLQEQHNIERLVRAIETRAAQPAHSA